MSNATIAVGCAGAGTLGAAIMRRLVDQGFQVRVWNRSKDKLAPVVAAGAIAVDTPAELAAHSRFIIVCVTDGKAVERTVFGDDGIAQTGSADKLLVDMSTIAAGVTRSLATRLRQHCGMGWLDAPISGGAPAALEGRMAVMVGGAQQEFDAAKPLWDALAGRATLMGGQGAGQGTKMINQTLAACTFAVMAEACALAQRAGVDAARIPAALAGGRADSRLLQEFMAKMATSDFDKVEGRLAIMLKDLGMIADLARETGAIMPVTSLVEQLHRKLIAMGLGDADNTEFVKLYRDGP
jgi:3-hydroxyisobutyrate dehydrogenase-like beta-hydroxyacid dehydrogenase